MPNSSAEPTVTDQATTETTPASTAGETALTKATSAEEETKPSAPKSKAEPDYLELFGRLMQRMGDTLTEASAQPHAVELAKIEAIMHERSISAENERAKIHADLERDRMKAQGRSQWFTVGVMTICAAAVLGLVRLQQQAHVEMILGAFAVLAGVVLGRKLDAGLLETLVRAVRREAPLPPAKTRDDKPAG